MSKYIINIDIYIYILTVLAASSERPIKLVLTKIKIDVNNVNYYEEYAHFWNTKFIEKA